MTTKDYFHVGTSDPEMDTDGLTIKGSEKRIYDGREILITPKYSNGGGKARKVEVAGYITEYMKRKKDGLFVSVVEPIKSKDDRKGIRKLLEGLVEGTGEIEFW